MPTSFAAPENQKRADRAARQDAHDALHHRPGNAASVVSSGVPALLSGQSLAAGRGNGPVRAAMMQRAQQVYGNRAVQRALRSRIDTYAPGRSAQRQASEDETTNFPVVPVPPVRLKGKPHEVTHYAKGGLKLQGKTTATFDGGEVETKDQTTEAATGCKGCKDESCVLVKGTIVMTFVVTTVVKLPKVPKKPKLTPCQKAIVQDAIDTTLSDHEQEHVAAFEEYNGTVEETFELTKCQKKAPAAVKNLANAKLLEVEKARRKEVKEASAALDPFNFDLDLTCEEPAPEPEPDSSQATP